MRTQFLFLGLVMLASSISAEVKCVAAIEACYRGEFRVGRDLCVSDPKTEGRSAGALCAPPREDLIVTEQCRGRDTQEQEACCRCAEPTATLFCEATLISPTIVQVFMQSALGLTSITPTVQENVDLTPSPPYDPGKTRDPVTVSAHKLDLSSRARVAFEVCDVAGCIPCDPVVALVIREAGKPEQEVFYDLPQTEGQVTIYNGSPGLRVLHVIANGQRFRIASLEDGEVWTLDVSKAMLPGDQNVITLMATGKPGGSATIMIHD
jgi:hypothetical protein